MGELETYTEVSERQVLQAQLVFESEVWAQFKERDERSNHRDGEAVHERSVCMDRIHGLLDRLKDCVEFSDGRGTE